MAGMSCREFVEQSGEWMEGEHAPVARSHWTACASCRSLIADLEAIRRSAAALPEEEPPSYLWHSVRAQIEREIRVVAKPSGWRERIAAWRAWRPALAGAYLALIIGVAVSLASHSGRANLTPAQTAGMQQNLILAPVLPAVINNASADENDVTATLNRNLAIVDNMISMCEKSVREDPQDEMARDYLYSAYQQKADLLAVMADSGGDGR